MHRPRRQGLLRARAPLGAIIAAACLGALSALPPAACAAEPLDPLLLRATTLLFPTGDAGAEPAAVSATTTLNRLKYLRDHGGSPAGAGLGQVGAYLQQPGDLELERATEHFVIHYSADPADAPLGWPRSDAFLAAAQAACEAAWSRYHSEQGWPVPPSLETGYAAALVHVYVRDLGTGVYGYALHEDIAAADGHAGFIVVDNDFAGLGAGRPIEALEATLAHEYHHVVQFGFGYAPEADWFMEQTAMLAEASVYWRPDQLRPYLEAFGAHAYRRLDACNGYFEYGAWLWPQFIVERWGWETLISIWRTWAGGEVPMLAATAIALEEAEAWMDPALQAARPDASVLDAAVLEWSTRNALLGERRPVDGHQHARGPELPPVIVPELIVDTYPVAGLGPEPIRQPEPLGANFVVLRPQAGSADNVLLLTLDVSAGLAGAQLIVLPAAGGAGQVLAGSVHRGICAFEVKDWHHADRAILVLTTGIDSQSACDYRLAASTRFAPKDGSASVDPDGAAERTWLRAAPNPFEPFTVLQYELPAAGHARLRIVDAQGRLVIQLADGPASAGRHGIYWDGRGAGGTRAAAGVYYALLESDLGLRETRIVRVR